MLLSVDGDRIKPPKYCFKIIIGRWLMSKKSIFVYINYLMYASKSYCDEAVHSKDRGISYLSAVYIHARITSFLTAKRTETFVFL
jgi:hypothetical protein